jgi:hypothetical protein
VRATQPIGLTVSFLVGISAACLTAVGLGFFFGGLTPGCAWSALGVGVAVSVLALRGFPRTGRRSEAPSVQPELRNSRERSFSRGDAGGAEDFSKVTERPGVAIPSPESFRRSLGFQVQAGPRVAEKSWADWAVFVLFTLFALRAFLWLVFTDGDEIRVLSPNNLGDLSLHLTYIRQLAGGTAWWPENPIYALAPLTYPLGMDLFNALWVLVGADVFRSLIWVGLGGAALCGVSLWRWGGAFTLLGFLCNGGWLGWQFFTRFELTDFQSEAAWKSLPLATLVTQRGLLFAIPAGLALLSSWRARFFKPTPDSTPDAPDGPLPFWVEALLYSSLPLFHLHTFLFLSFTLGIWFVVYGPARAAVLKLVGVALLPASLLVALVTGNFRAGSGMGIQPGWMQGDSSFFVFWGENFGVLPVFVGLLLWRIARGRTTLWPAALALPALLMFGLCCFVRFSPWEWDNTKLMLWSYLAVLPLLWSELLAHRTAAVRALCVTVLFFSGFISLLGGLDATHQGYPIGVRSELDGVAKAVAGIPFSERFVAAPAFNHPLLLNGRSLAMGYDGHVWSHGHDLPTRRAQVRDILNGEENWRAQAQLLGVRYVFWGAREEEAFPHSKRPWETEGRCVAQGEWGGIYDLRVGVPSASATTR